MLIAIPSANYFEWPPVGANPVIDVTSSIPSSKEKLSFDPTELKVGRGNEIQSHTPKLDPKGKGGKKRFGYVYFLIKRSNTNPFKMISQVTLYSVINMSQGR